MWFWPVDEIASAREHKKTKGFASMQCNVEQQMENGIAKSRSVKSLLVMKRQWAELPLNITNTYSGFYRNHWGFFKQYCRGLICKSACPNIMVHNETETQKWNHTSNAQQWKHTNTFCDCPSSMPRSGATAELHGGLVWLSFNQSLGTECTTEPHHHAEGLQRVCTDTAKSWHLWKWGSLRFTLYLCVGF